MLFANPGPMRAPRLQCCILLRGYFAFMTKDAKCVFQPVTFGSHRCHGNETRLHSHLGEGFAGDWAINKNHHMLFGTWFVWATNCYAIRFILSYDGNNLAVLHLQMHLMCWDVDIIHGNDTYLTNADFWSHLGADICYNPLFKLYLNFDRRLCEKFPAPTELPMLPENMPYYRSPHIIAPPTRHCSPHEHHGQHNLWAMPFVCTTGSIW